MTVIVERFDSGARGIRREGIVERMERIVNEHQWRKIEGVNVDVQSANAWLTVWRALSFDNAKKFADLPVDEACDLAWRLLR